MGDDPRLRGALGQIERSIDRLTEAITKGADVYAKAADRLEAKLDGLTTEVRGVTDEEAELAEQTEKENVARIRDRERLVIGIEVARLIRRYTDVSDDTIVKIQNALADGKGAGGGG